MIQPRSGTSTPASKPKPPKQSHGYWQLVWWRFRQNRLAVFGGILVLGFYVCCVVLADFLAPYSLRYVSSYAEAPPQRVRFIDESGTFHLRPFVYGYERKVDIATRSRSYEINPTLKYPIYFLVAAEPYRLMGLIPTRIRLFGTDTGNTQAHVFLFGTDRLGRDLYSRILYGGRLSLIIGLLGQLLTLVFGVVLGVVSGYFRGLVDVLIQRLTEFISAFPDIPLFLALAAAIPAQWSPLAVYFMLTVILSFVRWGGLARQVRGLVLSLREREYVLAAQSFGAGSWHIMFTHLLPGTTSHVIVLATLAIPSMILAETALSWLGLGLRPPLTSWGVLLQEVSSVRVIRFAPWLLLPVPFIIAVILGFNMLGDGLRDALDPYGSSH